MVITTVRARLGSSPTPIGAVVVVVLKFVLRVLFGTANEPGLMPDLIPAANEPYILGTEIELTTEDGICPFSLS